MSGEVWIGYQEKRRYWQSCQAMEQAAQGSGEVPIPAGCQKNVWMWFSRHSGVGLMVGLADLRGLFQP